MENKKINYWVTATDKFMSNWGMAKNKINKLVFECETELDADFVEDNLNNRSDMKHVNICTNKPRYSDKKYFVQIKNKEMYPNFYKAGYFRE